MREELTHALLLDILDYDPETGIFTWVHPYKRGEMIAGSPDNDGYPRTKIFGRGYKLHRLAWFHMMGVWPTALIDHRDCDVTNLKWNNLREATHVQNRANQGKNYNNRSGFKGVIRYGNRFTAQIYVNGKSRHLGNFDTPEEANAAYFQAAQEAFGEFARA